MVLPETPSLPTPDDQGMVPVNGGKLYYARYGKGDPVILLHGGLANSNYWGHQVPELARHYQVLVIDLRGHGRSPASVQPMTYDAMTSDVVGVMDHLHLPSAAFVGWSDGAIIGLTLAIQHPERVARLFAFGANFSAEGLIADGAHSATFLAYTRRAALEYQALSPNPAEYPTLLRRMRRMWSTEPKLSKGMLSSIQARTTIATGDHDEIIRVQHARDLAAAIPAAILLVEPRVSHFAMLQNPRQFTRDVLLFLGRSDDPAGGR